MDERKKRALVIGLLAALVFGYSLYDFVDKNTVRENPQPAVSAGGARAALSEVVVYVSGEVAKPGVFKLPEGSRALDAVNAAGGFTSRADSERINLAQPVKDGQQISVQAKAKPAEPNSPSTTAQNTNGDSKSLLININTASKEELGKLPGIGPSLAQRIIDYRTANGSFMDLSELRKVSGIGQVKFNQLKASITL